MSKLVVCVRLYRLADPTQQSCPNFERDPKSSIRNQLPPVPAVDHQAPTIIIPMSPDNISPAHSHNIDNNQQTCYFTYQPAEHWSTETPIDSPRLSLETRPDPNNPFLAARPAQLQPQLDSLPKHHMDVSKLMQFQTAAAYGSYNMSSRSSSSDSTRTSSDIGTPVIQDKSCSRCQTTHGSFIAYSLNSYYCTRCAKMTGYTG